MRGKPVLVQFLDPVHEALTDEKKSSTNINHNKHCLRCARACLLHNQDC